MMNDYFTGTGAASGGSPDEGAHSAGIHAGADALADTDTDTDTDTDAAKPTSTPALPSARPSRRARVGWFLVTLAAAALTARFGIWQLSRAHQKQASAALIAERATQAPLPASALARDQAQAPGQWQRRVVLDGRWEAAHTVFLMNRTMDERAGFFVMTPLRLAEGGAVLVQRGWLARDEADPMKAPPLATPDAPVHVQGRVAPWPAHWIDLGRGAPGAIRQNLEPAPFAAETGLALRPVMVIEDVSADNAHDGLRRAWAAPDIGVVTNYGYAVQWFAMSIGFFSLYAWLHFFRRPAAASDSRVDAPVDACLPP